MPHQCESLSEGIPNASDAIIPRQVPIWQRLPSEPLYFVGETWKHSIEKLLWDNK